MTHFYYGKKKLFFLLLVLVNFLVLHVITLWQWLRMLNIVLINTTNFKYCFYQLKNLNLKQIFFKHIFNC